ncbi:MAG: response regulator [Deltaproteobacteria bacterium]|nr:response regulator [Deltaproteobacteria bacterium]
MLINQRTVLVADDNYTNNMRLSVLLKRLDYSVIAALHCADVMKKMTAFNPDAVLMSVRLPEMGSATCLGYIKRDAKLKRTPVITMGDRTDSKVMEESLARGAAAYVFKPVSPTALYQVIQKLTEKQPRENVRARIIFKATIAYQNAKRVSFASILSERGVFIRTVKPIPVGTKVAVSMDLPSEKPVELEGTVIYAVEFNRDQFIEPGVCIQFSNVAKNIQLGLRKFVEEQLTYDLDPNLDL